ncbi:MULTISPECIES: amino acid ABC transporter permease [unclassified Rothia (in: high G+C Gram-positive bacteria)]|uniref:amino acid ABC transporter permease n=1 Tax=unclassified Rothia (in: high G+C Gram-positive bacteria) TaxID=2689056 RepID=UPI00195D5947|nr:MULTISPECIES: amino acid ABC transporter permease [unclassified Rothia (in: high G+C Gram-positive bacteria)]MBM7052148.1 amino acid ABC transporter permease [Rothia sp. ZJ1223]QRZ61419.1 amino acid ABC transporter permease [Rothia sp. ZJ932]
MDRYIELWIQSLPSLLEAMVKVTLPLTLIAFGLSLLIGIVATAMRSRSAKNPLNWLSRFYIWVFRGTPLLVQLFLIFYGLPKVGITLDTWTAAIITLSLNTGAYVAETFRASVASIPRGQFEAARTLNFTQMQTLRHVIIPQATRIALPPLGNDLIDLVKGTALVSTISLVDLFQSGKQVAARTYEPLAMYLEVAVLYLLIVTVLSWGQNLLEKRSSRYVRNANA